MNRSDNERLFAAVRAWAAVNYPGRSVRRVILKMDQGEPVGLPMPPAGDAKGDVEPLRGCAADILTVLRAAGRRMTTMDILAELDRSGMEWSDRTVKGCLAELVDAGTIDNDQKARPRGYGVADG